MSNILHGQDQIAEVARRGRAVTFSSALGEVLHHRRKQPRHTDESTLQALCEKVKLAEHGRRSPSPDSAPTKEGVEAEKSGGTGLKVVNDPKSWIWWGKPMWHDMGYLAVNSLAGIPEVKLMKGVRRLSRCLRRRSSGCQRCKLSRSHRYSAAN